MEAEESQKNLSMKAIWNNKIIAESNSTIVIEGNHYFPPDSVNRELLSDSKTVTSCFWKGIASYFNIEVNGKINKDGAWYYPDTTDAALPIKNYIAFWKGVEVTE